jgi:membrane protein YqaA with SNARE-associated domain
MSLSGHRHAIGVLAVLTFAESAVFPVPPDILLVPMVLAARDRAWLLASVCTIASVFGGLAGYGIG